MQQIENTNMTLVQTITYGDLAIIGAIIIVGTIIWATIALKKSK